MIFNLVSGGTSLGYDIVGSSSKPLNPSNNTMWVNTSTKITDHVFSSFEPSYVDGRIWIKTGSDSTVPVNILDENMIWLYPQFVMQASGATWVPVSTEIYCDNEWKPLVDISNYFIFNGRKQRGISVTSGVSISENDGNITFKSSSTGTWAAFFSDIDLTGINKISVEGTFISPSSLYDCLGVWTTQAMSFLPAYSAAHAALSPSGKTTLDVSALNGSYRIGVSWGAAVTETITSFYIE